MSDYEFETIVDILQKDSGAYLTKNMRQMLRERFSKRQNRLGIRDFDHYCDICRTNENERRELIASIASGESGFFMKPHHFEFMEELVLPHVKQSFRAWSVVSNTGAEGYSLAMTLDNAFCERGIIWEVLGTDIDSELVEKAKAGSFPMDMAKRIRPEFIEKYCLQNSVEQEGTFTLHDAIKRRVHFMNVNVLGKISANVGEFDVIFLHDFLCYFDCESMEQIALNVLNSLKPSGYLFIGHPKIGHAFSSWTQQIGPMIYQKKL